jgi:tetratricopeptide (TPR) repeat protein
MNLLSPLASLWWIYWGLLYRGFGNRFGWRSGYERAVRYFTRALAHAPQNAYLYYWRGTLYWRELNDPAQAEADLGRAIELAPRKMARAYLNRAFLRWYALPPDRARAAADFRAYLECGDEPYWRSVAQEHLANLEPGGAGPVPERVS